VAGSAWSRRTRTSVPGSGEAGSTRPRTAGSRSCTAWSSITTASKTSPSRPASSTASTRSTTPRSTVFARRWPAAIASGSAASPARTQSGGAVPAQAARQHSET
jgi:hypothetical protein